MIANTFSPKKNPHIFAPEGRKGTWVSVTDIPVPVCYWKEGK